MGRAHLVSSKMSTDTDSLSAAAALLAGAGAALERERREMNGRSWMGFGQYRLGGIWVGDGATDGLELHRERW